MQTGGEHFDEYFRGSVGLGIWEVAVARWLVERGDDGCFQRVLLVNEQDNRFALRSIFCA